MPKPGSVPDAIVARAGQGSITERMRAAALRGQAAALEMTEAASEMLAAANEAEDFAERQADALRRLSGSPALPVGPVATRVRWNSREYDAFEKDDKEERPEGGAAAGAMSDEEEEHKLQEVVGAEASDAEVLLDEIAAREGADEAEAAAYSAQVDRNA